MKELASNKEWGKWGELDPLFGVSTWQNKEKDGSNPWIDQEFYQLGESDWKDFSRHWEMYGVNRESCLEIGCGVGRITNQLASYFNQVHAIDVSEKMIEYAKKHISSSSVSFRLSKGVDIPLADQSVFSVFSTHVFQHFDSLSVADWYFAEISRTMKTDGTLMIHLPIYKWPSESRILKKIYAAQKTMGDIRARGKRLLMDYGMAKPLMRGLSYPVEYFYEVLPKYGFDDVEIAVFVTKINNAPHSFILARKKT
jgi:ubiquinone/menaquinone biosynthesis C-methylase UbiE